MATPIPDQRPADSEELSRTASRGPAELRLHSQHASSKNNKRSRADSSHKKQDLGRSEWSKTNPDRRKRNEDQQKAKKRRTVNGEAVLPVYATEFSKDDLAAEERRPKKKVAVLIGYSGTGYHGMQLTHDQRTIEGDLFKAFVAAGAISKANADDPKKSSFVRCARTDKGVHAAGNVISLKLIVEDEDVVPKINKNLDSRIRVWGYQRTNNSFSAYQLCDSRIYEYLIPTYSFLPPHPHSYLGRKLAEAARDQNDEEGWTSRQAEVSSFWEAVDADRIRPILDAYDEPTRKLLEEALYLRSASTMVDDVEGPGFDEEDNRLEGNQHVQKRTHGASSISEMPRREVEELMEQVDPVTGDQKESENMLAGHDSDIREVDETALLVKANEPSKSTTAVAGDALETTKQKKMTVHLQDLRRLRGEYVAARRAYRISAARLDRIQVCLDAFIGTRNHHNYTIGKKFNDASAQRLIKSFRLDPTPILIDGMEWLSLKVHGQSFMMHQIRKMVGMVALVVRCGCDPKRVQEAFGPQPISIPKAPGLGLLLERPVFDTYNKRAKGDLGKEPLDFDKYKEEMDEFKRTEIYQRIYREEEEKNMFGNFFNHIDNFANDTFLFVTSAGISASPNARKAGEGKGLKAIIESESEDGDIRAGHGDEG